MTRFIKKRSAKKGLSPGSLVHIGEQKLEKTRISVFDYTRDKLEYEEFKSIEKVFKFKNSDSMCWINIDGLHDTDLIHKLGQHFDIHPLIQEDILNTDHRPKIEEFREYIFIVLKILNYKGHDKEIHTEQLSIVLGKNFVITFQERTGDVFDPIRERLKNPESRIRINGTDFLAYALLDAVIDNYFSILEDFGQHIEDIEEELMDNPNIETLKYIHLLRRELVILRKSIWPLRELVNTIERSESSLITKDTKLFLRDLYDHVIQIIDTIENYREMASGMLDI